MNSSIKMTALSADCVYTEICKASESGAYAAYIRGTRCRTPDAYFKEVSAAFQFPGYFGENWGAMDECLSDLEWLHVKAIYVVVDDFHKLFRGNQKLQQLSVRVWETMCAYWTDAGIRIQVLLNN